MNPACRVEHLGVSCLSLMPLLPVICKNAAWAGLESKYVVAFSYLWLLRNAESCSPGHLDLDFPPSIFCLASRI